MDARALRDAFERQGYVRLPGFLGPDPIAALTAVIDRIHRQWLSENEAAFIAERLVNMHSLTHPHYFQGDPAGRRAFFALLAPPALAALLDAVFPPGLYFHNTQLFFNPYQNRRAPYWHRDLQYSPVPDDVQAALQHDMLSLHVRIPLLPETGLELVPGSHRRWDTVLERQVRFEQDGHVHSEDLPGAELIGLVPGDVLVFDAQMLHRGRYAGNPARKALDICVGRPHPLTAAYRDENVLPDTGDIATLAGTDWYRRAAAMATEKHRTRPE